MTQVESPLGHDVPEDTTILYLSLYVKNAQCYGESQLKKEDSIHETTVN